jgi:integrase
LRVQRSGLKWQLRTQVHGREHRIDLGLLKDWSIAEARELVTDAMRLLRTRSGFPTADWVHARRVTLGKVEPDKPDQPSPRLLVKWTFADGRTKFLAEVERTRRPATLADYRAMLSIPELKHLERQAVATITREELAEIVAKIHRSGRERYAEKLASAIRPMWTFLAADQNRKGSGVEKNFLDGLAAPERSKSDYAHEPEYCPPIQEVGRILAIARSGALDPVIALAVELLVVTVQRRRTVVTARIPDLHAWPEAGGVWKIPPAFRKTADSRQDHTLHVIPMIGRTWTAITAVVEDREAMDGDMLWLFGQFRPKRIGDELSHMNESVLTRALLLMPGVEASPHDLRRAFTTHMRKVHGHSLADIKTILDHNEGVASGDVTRTHYDQYDGRNEKLPIIKRWVADVESAAAEAVLDDPGLLDVAWLKREIAEARKPKTPGLVAAGGTKIIKLDTN